MKTYLLLIATVATVSMSLPAAYAGNCTYPTDRAADGSSCGGRASSIRPGGK